MTDVVSQKSLPADAYVFINIFRLVIRRFLYIAITLFTIAYITSFGLILAERGREHLPSEPLQAALQSFLRTIQYFFNHPQTYYWQKADQAAFTLVGDILVNSAGLLLIAIGVALILGISLGISAAVSKYKKYFLR